MQISVKCSLIIPWAGTSRKADTKQWFLSLHSLFHNEDDDGEQGTPISTTPLLSSISPNNKPALSRQRDHSACRRPDTPLKVHKTRENLRQQDIYTDIPPPCIHSHSHDGDHGNPSVAHSRLAVKDYNTHHARSGGETLSHQQPAVGDAPVPASPPPQPGLRMQRQKSVSRRMISRFKEGLSTKSKHSQSIRPVESETSLIRRLSGRRQPRSEVERRSQSFDIGRGSADGSIDQTPESASIAPSSIQRSITDSTVSTAELLEDSPRTAEPESPLQRGEESSTPEIFRLPSTASPPPPSSPSPQPTPRPPPKQLPGLPPSRAPPLSFAVPCVDLYVALDITAVDFHTKREIWVAIEATVRSMVTAVDTEKADPSLSQAGSTMSGYFDQAGTLTRPDRASNASMTASAPRVCGNIPSLRLCFKAVEGCRVREVIGQKSLKNLTVGQQCPLFIKLNVPKIRTRHSTLDPDQDSLFAELESIVGTLKMEILHVEARYRHSMLPSDNVVTVRHVCKIKRPKTESRWSIAGVVEMVESPFNVHVLLAQYLASNYPASHALDLLHRYLGPQVDAHPGVGEVYAMLKDQYRRDEERDDEEMKPAVVVTDIDDTPEILMTPPPEQYSTAPNTPAATYGRSQTMPEPMAANDTAKKRAKSGETLATLAPPPISAAKTTTALTMSTPTSSAAEGAETGEASESQDSARKLWRHIRHSSLSTKQLEDMTPERLQHLEASDDTLMELRRKALANKRSVGAETLRAWKWEDNVQKHERPVEAPWM
ncbi:hypothetical protein LTR37_007861 [Vermiconidia calcicola]|uniref:Uncharacterized protein n=1 Tax=Vermiconidia calcicola TaxID=1690605 RepID=A0ACC3NCM6_9PEZI|nr:hypothetical protein LTR37_007861 [Vermiconidia calcicola]